MFIDCGALKLLLQVQLNCNMLQISC